ncbi:MAG: type II secretion system protein [Nitrospirota bacterium]
MMKRQEGFSLIELMVAIAVFILVIAAAAGVFGPLVNQFKQQSKTAETNIEGIVGLELLRIDIEHAGHGLPWLFQNIINYNEAAAAPANAFNDAPSNLPRAIVSGNNVNYANIMNGSDYLIIKSTVVSRNDTSQRWSYIAIDNDPTNDPDTETKAWGVEDLQNNNRVIVIKPKVSETKFRQLVMNGNTYFANYSATSFPLEFAPTKPFEYFLIYGIDPDTDPRMPFNRADYFVSTTNLPQRCATNTGVLEKVVVNQSDGGLTQFLPLLDCVADMQIIYRLDMDDNGEAGTYADADGSNVSSTDGGNVTNVQQTMGDAELLRNRLKEIRVYVLAHEGQIDRFFTFSGFTLGACPTCIRVGEMGLGRDFDISTIPDYLNYRWKVYTLVVRPQNLR